MKSDSQSPVFLLSDKYISESAKLSPINSSYLGIKGLDDRLDDFSLAASEKKVALIRQTLSQLDEIKPDNEIQRISGEVLRERLISELALNESNEAQILMAVQFSPAISIRQVFEVMPYENDADFSNFTARFSAVDAAHQSWKSALEDLAKMGKRNSRRQVEGVAKQLLVFSKGAYSGVAKKIDPAGNYPKMHTAAASADRSAGEMGVWLQSQYLPDSIAEDGVGAERYGIWARHYTGVKLDLRETYEWGLRDLAEINERMWKVARKIKPDAKSLREVGDFLDKEEKYLVRGSDLLLEKLLAFTAAATAKMDGVYFDIDERIKFCDARLAPEGSAAAPYYLPPSEDLSRPGTTWFPTLGKNEFSWWRIPTYWYHEAVPGHHLQVATKIIEKDRLSRFQRTGARISGYSEGWALYAERFMDELGAFDDPGYEIGHLAAQAWRAVRVVVDIGMHLGYAGPDGKVWNAESACQLLMEYAMLDEEFARSEIDRYLGIAGQAISYKVGERVWMNAREDAKQRFGDKFSLKKFHAYALKLGPMGLDAFAAEMAKWDGN